ncbi:MAG: iron ABC transporter permease [Syntrophales bacterium]|nr:iron ABC transporter permease [Syntrophales bacterium]
MRPRRSLYFIILLSPLFVGILSLFVGSYDIAVTDVLRFFVRAILNPSGSFDSAEWVVVFDIRLCRILLAGIVGVVLAATGATFQGLFRNPLVDPYILGISAGAAFGCAISIGFLPYYTTSLFAFSFGILAVLLTCWISQWGHESRLTMVLSGVVVSAFFTALVSIVKFLVDPAKLQNIVYWLMGSFSLAEWKSVFIVGLTSLLGLTPIYLMRWRLNVISMGEEARAMGVDIKRDRAIFITASTLAVSTAVSASGIIGWVGLMVPHLVRMISGPDHRLLIPLSMSGGAAFLITADTIARVLTAYDLPVGLVTAITGAPFFVYLLKKGGRESWGR